MDIPKYILLIILSTLPTVLTQINLYINAELGQDPINDQNLSACAILTPTICTLESPCKTLPCAFQYAIINLKSNPFQDLIITLMTTSNSSQYSYPIATRNQTKPYSLNFNGSFTLKGDAVYEVSSNETCSNFPTLSLQYIFKDPMYIKANGGVTMQYLNINALVCDGSFNIYNSGFSLENTCITMTWDNTDEYLALNYRGETEEEWYELDNIYWSPWYKVINLKSGYSDNEFLHESNSEDINSINVQYNISNIDYMFSNIIITYDGYEYGYCDDIYMPSIYFMCYLYDQSALITHTTSSNKNASLPSLYFSNLMIDCGISTNYMKFFYSPNSTSLTFNQLNTSCFSSFKIAIMGNVDISNINLYNDKSKMNEDSEEYYYDYGHNAAKVFDLSVSGNSINIQNIIIDNFEVGICYSYFSCDVSIYLPSSVFFITIVIYNTTDLSKSLRRLLLQDIYKTEFEQDNTAIMDMETALNYSHNPITYSDILHRNLQAENEESTEVTIKFGEDEEYTTINISPDSLPDLSQNSNIPWNASQYLEQNYSDDYEVAYRKIIDIEETSDIDVIITLKNITISNNILKPNNYDAFFSFILISSSQSAKSTKYILQDILYINNKGHNAYQTYGFRLYDANIYYLNNITYTQNNISRFATMGTVSKPVSPILKISDIDIINNTFNLINYDSYEFDVYIIDDPTMGIIDFTSSTDSSNILLSNINIQDNNFTSVIIISIDNSIIYYQFKVLYTFLSDIFIQNNIMNGGSFISITGYNTYVDNINCIGNIIQSSDLLYLGKQDNQFNAFIVQNSTFTNNKLNQSSLLQKNLDLESALVFFNVQSGLVLPFWITLSNCTFQNLTLTDDSIAIHVDSMPFTFIVNNTFYNITILGGSELFQCNDFVDSIKTIPMTNIINAISLVQEFSYLYLDSYTAQIFYMSWQFMTNTNIYNELIDRDIQNNETYIFMTRIAVNTFDTLYTSLSNILHFQSCETEIMLLSIDNNNIINTNLSDYMDKFLLFDSIHLIGISYNNFTIMKGNGYIIDITDHLKGKIYRNIFMNNAGSSLLAMDSNNAMMTIIDQNIIKNVYSNFTFISLVTQYNQGKIIFRRNNFINITIRDYIYTYQQLNFIYIRISKSTGSLMFYNNIFGNIEFIKNHTSIIQFDNSFIFISNPDDEIQVYDTIYYNISILYDNNLLTIVAKLLDLQRTTLSLIYNFDEWGSLYYLGPKLSIYQCNFQYNFAYNGKGGAIFVDHDNVEGTMTKVNITKSYFRNNFATLGSSFYYAGMTIEFNLDNNTFYQGDINTFDKQYILSYMPSLYGVLAFYQTALYNNSTANATILYSQNNSNGLTFFLFIDMVMVDEKSMFTISTFDANINNDYFTAIEILNSSNTNFILNNITISPNTTNFYNVSLLIADSANIIASNLTLTSLTIYTSFINLMCNSNGNAILQIFNSTFKNFTIPIISSSLGLMHISSQGSNHNCYQSLLITNTTFSNFKVGIISDWTQDFSIIYSNYPGNMSISLHNTTFQNITSIRGPSLNLNNWPIAPNILSGYLAQINSNANTTSSSSNSGINAELQNIYYYYDTNITINNCTFTNNTAFLEGGSIYNTYNNLTITNTIFTYNQAQYRSGGAIFSFNTSTFGFILNKMNNNTFLSNKRYSIKLNGTYSDEAPLGTPPIAMNITLNQSNNSYANIINFTMNNSFQISNVTSNELQYIMFILGLYDSLGQIFYESPSGDIELSSLLKNIRVIKMISNVSTTSTSDCDFANCYITPITFTLKGIAGTQIPINFTYQSMENTVPNVEIITNLRGCIIGEINSSNIPGGEPAESFCTICPPKLYSLNLNDSNCNSCNFGDTANCLGGSNIYIGHGYWRPNNLSDVILECPNFLACIGGVNSECAYGYDGPLCQSCNGTAKFARSGPNMCGSCPGKTQQTIIAVSFVLLIILHQIYMIRSSLLENIAFYEAKITPDQEKAKIQGQYLRLLTTYGQIISIVLSFKLEYPSFIGDSVGNISKSPTNTIFTSTYCFLLDLDYSPDELTFSQIVLVSTIPLIKMIVISFLLIIAFATCKRKTEPAMKKAYFIISIFCVILVEQPSLFNSLVSYLTCIRFKSQDKFLLLSDYAVECFTPKYNYYLMLIVIPSILIWGFLIPAILFIILFKNRKNLNNKLLRLNLGGIYNEYTDSAFYWGIVLMVMKLMLMFTASILYNDVKTEALTIFVIIFIYLLSHFKIQPIKREEMHKAEQLSTASYLLTIFFAIYYKDNKFFACQMFAIIIMAAANFFVIGLIIYKLALLNSKFIPCLKKFMPAQNIETEVGLNKPKSKEKEIDIDQIKVTIDNSTVEIGDETKANFVQNMELSKIIYENTYSSRDISYLKSNISMRD